MGSRPILLNNKLEKVIPFYIYDKLEVGDSIVKKPKSDIEFYIKKNGEIIKTFSSLTNPSSKKFVSYIESQIKN